MSPRKASPSKKELKFPTESKDLPATQGMLQLVRTELKADIGELRSEMKSEFHQVNSKFEQVDSRFEQVVAEMARMSSNIARIGILVEEQNSKNNIVMENLSGLFHRQDRVEARVDEMQNVIQSIATRSKT